MAAVIDLRSRSAAQYGAPVLDGAPAGHPRPSLSLIQGGRTEEAIRTRRMYLRRRVLAAAVVAVLLVLALGALSSAVGALAGSSSSPEPTQVHRVERGDTLWSIARSVAPSADVRDVIDRIVDLNATGDAAFSTESPLRVGQQLLVPAAGG